MVETEDLFTFELDMGAGTDRMTYQQLEDVVYNCLDFCLLYRKRPHFFLSGRDAAYHPALWELLDILRQEGATFSILSGPEQTAYEQHSPAHNANLKDKIEIRLDGEAYGERGLLGNILEDRLADLWAIKRMEAGEAI